ncbi:hypothetical protein [Sulfobacillus sp. hq2]|uniref:hypothetical protein n=1 Tax=Sulfobacillus TaxID=28033 RepID=UPI000CD2E772|nr:hypothetical protein [Sulfobacillus sp. hq2]POB10122.1 hypothetical protein CO251_11600 [Sulfobacillus sp. hq2]
MGSLRERIMIVSMIGVVAIMGFVVLHFYRSAYRMQISSAHARQDAQRLISPFLTINGGGDFSVQWVDFSGHLHRDYVLSVLDVNRRGQLLRKYVVYINGQNGTPRIFQELQVP